MLSTLKRHGRFLRYLLVGGTGFAADLGGMEILVAAGMGPYAARLFSMAFAIAMTFALHRHFTFADTRVDKASPRQFSGYVFCQVISSILNYGVFYCLLRVIDAPEDMLARGIALCGGVGAGLLVNYFLLRRFVFSEERDIWAYLKQKIVTEKKLWIWAAIIPALFADAWDRQRDVLAVGTLKRALEPWDPDVWMRLYKVREWLIGGDFYDRTVAMTNAPFGGVTTPWTRPMDFLLAFFVRLMPQDLTIDQQLMLAATWLPLLLAVGTLYFLCRAARQSFDHLHVIIVAILLMMVNAVYQNYLIPGNADHHGLLILLWCAALSFILQPPSYAAQAVAGILLGLMLWVSPEAVMLIGVVYAVLAARALWYQRDIKDLAVLSAAVAVTAAVALLFEVPPAQYFSAVIYDSLSIVYVALFSFVAVAIGILGVMFKHTEKLVPRICAATAAALTAVAATLALFPKLVHGPMAEMHPYIFSHFLPSISEAKPLLKSTAFEMVIRLYIPLTAIFLLVKSHYSPRPFWRERRTQFLSALLALTLAMTMAQLRWNYYLQPVAIIIIAYYLPLFAMGAKSEGFGWLKHAPRMLRPYAWLFLLACIVSAASIFVKEDRTIHTKFYSCQSQIRYLLESGEMEKVFGPKPVTLFLPANVGGDVAFFTPYRIIAGNYHREGQGMSDWRDIMQQKTPAAARPLLKKRDVKGLIVCAEQYSEDSWLRQLDKKYPSWLKPVTGMPAIKMADDTLPVIFKVK